MMTLCIMEKACAEELAMVLYDLPGEVLNKITVLPIHSKKWFLVPAIKFENT